MSGSSKNETRERRTHRLALPLVEGLAAQARRDAITKLGRKHGVKVCWDWGPVNVTVGGKRWQWDASDLDTIERVLGLAIQQAGALESAA